MQVHPRALASVLRSANVTPRGFRGVRLQRILRALDLPAGRYLQTGQIWHHEHATIPQNPRFETGTDAPKSTVRLRLQRPRSSEPTDAQAVVVRKRELVLLRVGEATTRLWTDGTVDPRFFESLAVLASNVTAPSFTPLLNGRGLRSSWVSGAALHDVTPDVRVSAVRHLLREMAATTRRTIEPDRADFVSQILTIGRLEPEHRATFNQLATSPHVAELRGLPLALQHGDPGAGNVIVRPDGVPMLIDWTPMTLGVRPFWSDAAHIVSVDGHRPLLAGAFDAELVALWNAAGVPLPTLERLRELMLTAGVLFYAMSTFTLDESGNVRSLITDRGRRISKPGKVERALVAACQAAAPPPG